MSFNIITKRDSITSGLEAACDDYRTIATRIRKHQQALVLIARASSRGDDPASILAAETLIKRAFPPSLRATISDLSISSSWIINGRMPRDLWFMNQSSCSWSSLQIASLERDKRNVISLLNTGPTDLESRNWMKRWKSSIVIDANDDGDYVCVDLRRGHAGEVFAVSHDNDYFHGKVLCDNVAGFMIEWLRVGLISTREPFLAACTDGFTKPFSSKSEIAVRWRRWLGVEGNKRP